MNDTVKGFEQDSSLAYLDHNPSTNTPLVARPCNSEMVEFLNKASDVRLVGRPELYDDYHPVPHPPMWLTDRHLASEHSLQRVVLASDLLQNMEREGNAEVIRFLSENDEFPGVKALPKLKMSVQIMVEGASAFMFRYLFQVVRICARFATTMQIMPNQRGSGQAFTLHQYQPYPIFLNQAELRLFGDYRGLQFPDFKLPEEAIKKVSRHIIEKLRVVRDSHNCLATFNYLPPCPESDKILTEAINYGPDSWITPTTISPKTLDSFDRPVPLDTPNRWWSEYGTRDASDAGKRVHREVIKHRNTVWIPPRKDTRGLQEPEAREFIQRAWCRAVETDTTFMVISSGNKERIGIRHRESQTLFLSDLMDPFKMPYVKTHMFLYNSILKEALDRATSQPLPAAEPHTAHKRKDHPDAEDRRMSKRLRGESSSGLESGNIDTYNEISSRNILLVSFDFGVYHSSSPSSFVRVSSSCHPDFVSAPIHRVKGNKKYPISECMNFVATAKVGSGRTGAAFRGVVQIQTGTGAVIEERVILKIPLGAQPVSRIHDEYKIYAQIAKAGITEGILPVYGVFEDIESGSVVIMMRDGGTDLWKREQERKASGLHSGLTDQQISLSQDEFDVLYRVITRINASNILHFDVKPNNILCDENGKLSLIDFDSACHRVRRDGDPESADILTLHDLFAGTFVKDGYYPR